MIRDVLGHGGYVQEWRLGEVLHRKHYMTQMDGVLRDEPVTPIVERQSKLRWTAGGFCDSPIRPKPKIGTPHQNWGALRMVRGCDAAVRAGVRSVDPIVDRQSWVGDACFGIHF